MMLQAAVRRDKINKINRINKPNEKQGGRYGF